MSKHNDFTVTVHGERAELFEAVFGTPTVHVQSPIPVRANLPGFDEPQEVYLLDLSTITPEQRARLIKHISHRFSIPDWQVGATLVEHGVPILATDCSTTIANPQRWL